MQTKLISRRISMSLFVVFSLMILATVPTVSAQTQSELARQIMGGVNAEYYFATYPDVRDHEGYGRSPEGAVAHYINHGIQEERRPNPFFDPWFYRSIHPDLHNHNPQQLRDHWLNHGILEGRRGSPEFHLSWYLNENKDLLDAFGEGNTPAAFDHYLRHGMYEPRLTSLDGPALSRDYLQNLTHYVYNETLPVTIVNGISLYKSGFHSRVEVAKGHAEWFISPEGNVSAFLRIRVGSSGRSRITTNAILLNLQGQPVWISQMQTLTVGAVIGRGSTTKSERFAFPEIPTEILEQAVFIDVIAARDTSDVVGNILEKYAVKAVCLAEYYFDGTGVICAAAGLAEDSS